MARDAVRAHFDEGDPDRPLTIRLHLERDELIPA